MYCLRTNTWPRDLNTDFTLCDCSFGAVKFTKKTDLDKYGYSGYGFRFDAHSQFWSSNGEWDKNLVILELIIIFSLYDYNRKKDMLFLDEGPTDGLDDATLTAEDKYSINITKSNNKMRLNLHYNGGISFLYVNEVKYINSK